MDSPAGDVTQLHRRDCVRLRRPESGAQCAPAGNVNQPAPKTGRDEGAPRSQAYERVYRRWSLPAPTEVESGATDVVPDPASYRVYSPAELRSAPLRQAYRGAPAKSFGDDVGQLGSVAPSTILRWVGLGAAIGTLVLTAFVLVLNLTDDPRAASLTASARSTLTTKASTPSSPVLTAPASVAVDAPLANDFELPDDTQAGATGRSARTRATSKVNKPKLAVRDVPF
jgi:hypothetical protein